MTGEDKGAVVRAMLKKTKASSYALARAVSELQEDDPGAFQGLVSDAGILRRRLYYLGKVGRALIAAGLSDEALGGIGWTKLSVIAEHLNAQNADELIALARSSTVIELRQAIGLGGSRQVKHLTLRLDQGDYDRVVSALVLHGATIQKSGVKNAGPALLALLDALPKA